MSDILECVRSQQGKDAIQINYQKCKQILRISIQAEKYGANESISSHLKFKINIQNSISPRAILSAFNII